MPTKQKINPSLFKWNTTGKLIQPSGESQAVGCVGSMEIPGGSFWKKAVGRCPEAIIQMGKHNVRCLLDSGAQVSTMTETFFRHQLSDLGEPEDVSAFIQITGAQGITVPYIGYVEIDIEVMGQNFSNMGFLVVKDPVGSPIEERKLKVPVVIGSNILREIQSHIKGSLGDQYLSKLAKWTGGSEWAHVLALYGETSAEFNSNCKARVRVAGKQPQIIDARSIIAIVETAEEIGPLPVGVAVGKTCVAVDGSGRIPVQVTNFGCEDVFLEPRMQLARLEEVVVQPLITVQTVNTNEVRVEFKDGATVDSQQAGYGQEVESLLSRMDVAKDITGNNLESLKGLLQKHIQVFSKDDKNIGFCPDIKHHIRTTDDIPIRLPHRRIPPNQWEEVREYLKSSIEQGIIRESSKSLRCSHGSC